METNPKNKTQEQCKAIMLWSGKDLQMKASVPISKSQDCGDKDAEQDKDNREEKAKEAKSALIGSGGKQHQLVPLVPFPEQLKNQKLEHQFSKFLEVFKKFHINIPFVEALEQMSTYAKFMKEILSKKRRLGDCETVALMEECSAVL